LSLLDAGKGYLQRQCQFWTQNFPVTDSLKRKRCIYLNCWGDLNLKDCSPCLNTFPVHYSKAWSWMSSTSSSGPSHLQLVCHVSLLPNAHVGDVDAWWAGAAE
jgi:hypothetical protein